MAETVIWQNQRMTALEGAEVYNLLDQYSSFHEQSLSVPPSCMPVTDDLREALDVLANPVLDPSSVGILDPIYSGGVTLDPDTLKWLGTVSSAHIRSVRCWDVEKASDIIIDPEILGILEDSNAVPPEISQETDSIMKIPEPSTIPWLKILLITGAAGLLLAGVMTKEVKK